MVILILYGNDQYMVASAQFFLSYKTESLPNKYHLENRYVHLLKGNMRQF